MLVSFCLLSILFVCSYLLNYYSLYIYICTIFFFLRMIFFFSCPHNVAIQTCSLILLYCLKKKKKNKKTKECYYKYNHPYLSCTHRMEVDSFFFLSFYVDVCVYNSFVSVCSYMSYKISERKECLDI